MTFIHLNFSKRALGVNPRLNRLIAAPAYLEGKTIVPLAEYAKKEKLSHSNLINKANRQTIEAFWERGQWKIGV